VSKHSPPRGAKNAAKCAVVYRMPICAPIGGGSIPQRPSAADNFLPEKKNLNSVSVHLHSVGAKQNNKQSTTCTLKSIHALTYAHVCMHTHTHTHTYTHTHWHTHTHTHTHWHTHWHTHTDTHTHTHTHTQGVYCNKLHVFVLTHGLRCPCVCLSVCLSDWLTHFLALWLSFLYYLIYTYLPAI
jgi:hypothetical protein